MLGGMMIRRTITALLVALVASFALSSPASAATKKTARPRVKHSSHAAATTRTKPAVKATTRTKPAAKKKAVKKKTAKSSTTAKKSGKTQKRKPTTKPQ
jgi:hypothetical protein